jgi:uncharacterized membrane protein YphA (DoxX/SURF4 family)
MDQVSQWLRTIDALSARVATSLRWLSPSLARLTVGMVFLQSGWGKLHSLDQVTAFFTDLGLPAPAFHALLVSGTELVGGALVLAGLATRFAVVPLAITMVVAMSTALREQISGLGSLVGLLEFAYLVLLVWIGTHGPGPLSADAWIAVIAARSREHRAQALMDLA